MVTRVVELIRVWEPRRAGSVLFSRAAEWSSGGWRPDGPYLVRGVKRTRMDSAGRVSVWIERWGKEFPSRILGDGAVSCTGESAVRIRVRGKAVSLFRVNRVL